MNRESTFDRHPASSSMIKHLLNKKPERAMNGNYTLGENAYINIKNLILSGKYEPGKKLQYDEVATELGISNTPLKEAFLKLEREGFVEVISRKGTYVKKITKQDALESYQIREVLEGLSAKLACINATSEDVSRLKENLEKLKECIKNGDSHKSVAVDIEFHEEIARIAGSKKLLEIIQHNMLTNVYAIAGLHDLYLNIGEDAIRNHGKLIELIEKKDCENAEAIMKKQISEAASYIVSGFKEDH